jgi:hypothetical protein
MPQPGRTLDDILGPIARGLASTAHEPAPDPDHQANLGHIAYLHLYLMLLWDALGELEQKKGAAPIADRVFPWLISHAALWYRNRARKDNCAVPPLLPITVFENIK